MSMFFFKKKTIIQHHLIILYWYCELEFSESLTEKHFYI